MVGDKPSTGGRRTGMSTGTVTRPPDVVPVGRHRPDIQGLRAIAVLVVVAFHAGLPLSGGFTGVDIFFVISGFVITGLILRDHIAGTFRPATFFVRRAKRLLPALALMCAVVLVMSLLFLSPFGPQEQAANTAIGAMLLVANMVILRTQGDYFDAAAEANPLLHTWSLSVEEQFYLVFPFILIGLLIWGRRRNRSPGIPLIALGLLNVTSFLISLLLSLGFSPGGITSQPESWAFYTSVTRAWEFGIGAMLAMWLSHRSTEGRLPISATGVRICGVAGLILVALSMIVISPSSLFPGFIVLLPTTGALLLLWAGSSVESSSPIQRGLASPVMVYLGDRSYSLYLWHWPVIYFAVVLFPSPRTAWIAAIVSFFPALASFRFVEQPLRLSKTWVGRRVALGSLAMAILVIFLAIGVRSLGVHLVPNAAAYADDRVTSTLSTARECFLTEPYAPSDIERCTYTVPDATGWMLLAGDSHASAISTGAITAAHELGLDVIALNGGNCPFVPNPETQSGVSNCAEMNAELLNLATGANPASLVMIVNKGVPTGLDQNLKALDESGIPVVFVRNVPRWSPLTDWVGGVPCTGGVINFTCDVPQSKAESFDGGTRGLEESLLSENPDITAYDPWPQFCASGECSPVIEGQLGYFDVEHINGLGSAALTTDLRMAIARALKTS